jgi:GH43 family beta-xylosidase
MKLLKLVPIMLGSVCLVGAALAQASNPILSHPDPFITLDPATSDGQYVLAATGNNITLWSGPTPATASATPHVIYTPKAGMTQTWSPTIWKIDGHWWVYFTAQELPARHKIYVLESDTDDVLGHYSFKGALETGRQSIDPSLLVVGDSRYLMYVTVDSGANDIYIRKLKTPTEFDGKAALIAHPEAGWEKGEGSTKNYPVNEGPTALYHDGKTFIVFSASDTASPRYCLGLLTLMGTNPMDPKDWTKTPHPVFAWSPANGIYGPGRGTFAKGKDGSMWLLYAAKTTDAPNAGHRETRAQRFTWNADGSPNFGAPVKDGSIQP